MIYILVIFWSVLKSELSLSLWNKAASDNGRSSVDAANGVSSSSGIGTSTISAFTNPLMMTEGRMPLSPPSTWFGRMCRVLVGIWIV